LKKVKLRSFLKKYWRYALVSPIFMIGEVAIDLLLPKKMASIVNTAVENTDVNYIMSSILRTSIEMLILVAIGGFFGLMCCYTASKASQGFGNDVRIASFKKVMSLSLEQTDKFTTGSLVTRLTNDITTVQDVIQMMLRMLPRSPMFFIGGLYMCLTLDVSFFIIVAIALPIILAIVLFMVFKATPLFSVVQKNLDRVNSVVQESVTGARVVKAYSREEYEMDRFDVANKDYKKVNLKVSIIMSTIFPLMSIVVNATVIAIIYIGGLRVQAATYDVGDIMAAVQYVTQILMSIMMISMIFQNIARGKACADRVREVLETEPIIRSGNVTESLEKGTVCFENVSFKYPEAKGRNVIDNVSFEIKRGETVAIIGATGSGKTSLVNLIPRFYDAIEGRVLVDGVDVKEWDTDALRERIGFVLQKSELFSGTIDENIRWGKDDAELEEIVSAAKIAQADEFISKMGEGYDSYVAEKGASLSGGQKQRIAISRAVLKNPEILIFDDSTSALDLSTEAKLRAELLSEFADTTVIMIAQRIASVMHADRIAIIENGRITAFDNHEKLMKSSETYRDIYSSQMKSGGDLNG